MCRFCEKRNLRFQNETLAVGLHGALVLTMRTMHNDTGWGGEDVVLSAYSSELCGYCNYRPKFCPECGRKLREDVKETASGKMAAMRAKDLRAQNRGTDHRTKREPCVICGKHRHITHLHHVVSFYDCVTILKCYDEVQTALIWLCPNCHAYVHNAQKGLYSGAMGSLSDKEFAKLNQIVDWRFKLMFPNLDEQIAEEERRMGEALDSKKGDA